MPKPICTLRRWLAGAAGIAGVLFAATAWTSRNAEELAATVIVVMAVASLVSALRMRRSSFWLGFTALGWGWLAICLGTPLGPVLLETRWIDAARPPLVPAPNPHDWFQSHEYLEYGRRDRDAYRRAGHCVVSLLLALVGGAASRRLLSIDDREPSAWRTPDGSLFSDDGGESSEPSLRADLPRL